MGGLAFAIAPYRLAQSAGHLLGWIAVLVPIALWAFERSRAASTRRRAHAFGAVAALALLSIPASGQLHLALGAIPFCVAYAIVRRRRPAVSWLLTGAAVGIGIAYAVKESVIDSSVQSRGRTLEQIETFQADWGDLVSRFRLDGLEQYTYLGWLTLVLGVVGLVLIARRAPWLAAVLGLALVVPLLLAVGTNLPIYEPLWRHFPPLHFPRVPGRLVPIADLALAALAAVGVAWSLARFAPARRTLAAAIATLLVAGDLLVLPLHATAADPANAAYGQLARERRGRAVELPLFEPGIHYGSVYLYYATQAPRQRPGGYSTMAPLAPYSYFWSLNRLNCGAGLPEDEQRLRSLGVRYLLFHAGAYEQARRPGAWFAWQALQLSGSRAAAEEGRVWLFPLDPDPSTPAQPAPVPEPDRSAPVFCESWRGWTMKERDAAIWIWGADDVELELAAPERSEGTILVDGTRRREFTVDGRLTLVIPLQDDRWHVLLLEVPALFPTDPPQGFELVRLTFREGDTEREVTPGG